MENKKNIVAIIQARMGSSRLPGKILMDLGGKPMLSRVIERVQQSRLVTSVVVATTTEPKDDQVEKFVKENHRDVMVYRGSEHDVLDRYYQAASAVHADAIVRITSDCPFIDPAVIDQIIEAFETSGSDYAANILDTRTYPRGLDAEVFSFAALEKAWKVATDHDSREHVTLFIKKHPELFTGVNVTYAKDYSGYRWTVDEPADYQMAKAVYDHMAGNPNFRMEDVVALFKTNPELANMNQAIEQKNPHF